MALSTLAFAGATWAARDKRPLTAEDAPIVVGMLAVVGVIVFLVIRHERRRNAARVEAWRAFAAVGGFRFEPPEGGVFSRFRGRISGEVGGRAFEIGLHVVSHGKSSTTYTRAVAPLRTAGCDLVVWKKGFWSGLGESVGMAFESTGDPTFDERFVVRSAAPEAVSRILNADVRRSLLDFPKPFSFRIEKGEARLQWRGAEIEDSALARAARAVTSAAAAT